MIHYRIDVTIVGWVTPTHTEEIGHPQQAEQRAREIVENGLFQRIGNTLEIIPPSQIKRVTVTTEVE